MPVKTKKLTEEEKKSLTAEFKRLKTIISKILPAGKKRDEIIANLDLILEKAVK